MKNRILLILIVPIFAFAAYNPFFTSNKPAPKVVQAPITVAAEPVDAGRKNIQMAYFGFIETNKGVYALVGFNGKNIVVREADAVYLDAQTFTVNKISQFS